MPALLGLLVAVFIIGVIVVVSIFVGAAILLFWPAINFIFYAVARFRVRQALSIWGMTPQPIDFHRGVLEDDKITLKRLDEKLEGLDQELDHNLKRFDQHSAAATDTLQPLRKELEGLGDLPRNKDGSYSLRSDKGKQAAALEEDIKSYESRIYSNNVEKDRLKREKNAQEEIGKKEKDVIAHKPIRLWNEWRRQISQLKANRNAILSMVLSFPILFVLIALNTGGSFQDSVGWYLYYSQIYEIAGMGSDSREFLESLYAMFPVEFEFPFGRDVFSWKMWALYMLPVPVVTFLVYKWSEYSGEKSLEKEVPKPCLYDV